MKQSKAAKAFLAKLATLTIGTGAKAPACGQCGKPMQQHKLVGFGVAIVHERRAPKRDASQEQAFAA